MSDTPQFDAAYAACLDDAGTITRLEPLYEFAKSAELELKKLDSIKRSVHAAHGLLAPLGNQVTPSVMAIREALSILRCARAALAETKPEAGT